MPLLIGQFGARSQGGNEVGVVVPHFGGGGVWVAGLSDGAKHVQKEGPQASPAHDV